MIIGCSPFRISFYGGGSEIPKYFREFGGITVTASIDKYVYLSVRKLSPIFPYKVRASYSELEHATELDDVQHRAIRECIRYVGIKDAVDISIQTELPKTGGIGSSSSTVVALLNTLYALMGKNASKEELARDAIHIEREVLQEAGGWGDQYAAAYGGLSKYIFNKNGVVTVEPIAIDPDFLPVLEDSIVLFNTEMGRLSGETSASYNPLPSTILALKQIAHKGVDAINNCNLEEMGRLLHQNWEVKKSLSPIITNSNLDTIYLGGMNAGALGGKICGAGNGGFIMFLCRKELQHRLINALSGLVPIKVKFDWHGTRLLFIHRN